MSLSSKRLYLLDMDGTIYLGNDLFDGTIDFLEKVKKNGGRYIFVTNNSSKSAEAYVQKLRKIGIEADVSDFLTSTDATIIYLEKYCQGKRVYCVGTRSFIKQLSESGINVTEKANEAEVLVLSNDTELTFEKLFNASVLLTEGKVEYIATNPDWVCPTSFGYVPDCGSFCEMLYRATGKRPKFIGKPEPEMLLLAMEKFGYTKEETLMVGDRLYTDIKSGVNAGVDTVFVLSGEGTLDDLRESDVKPTYTMKNIRELCDNI